MTNRRSINVKFSEEEFAAIEQKCFETRATRQTVGWSLYISWLRDFPSRDFSAQVARAILSCEPRAVIPVVVKKEVYAQEKPASFSENNARWHELLEYVLDGGVPVAVQAVTMNLEAFYLTTKMAHQAGGHGDSAEFSTTGKPSLADSDPGGIAGARSATKQPEGDAAPLRPRKRQAP